MASDYYLLKTEPTGYSFADLQRDSVTEWDGVSNPVALRNLREMKAGTKLVVYETGDVKSAVGTAAVVSVNIADPKNPNVMPALSQYLRFSCFGAYLECQSPTLWSSRPTSAAI